jgi:hypothetical protein
MSMMQQMEKDNPGLGFSMLVAHSSSKKDEEEKGEGTGKGKYAHLPSFNSWQSQYRTSLYPIIPRVAGIFQSLVTQGSKQANMAPADWVLSVLPADMHSHASLLNCVLPGLYARNLAYLTSFLQ